VRELFNAPGQFADVTDLARAAGFTRRTVERWLTRVGIASPKLLVVSARVERAHHIMRSTNLDVSAVARRVGYVSPRLFARQVALATGWPPTAFRYTVTADDLLRRLVAALSPVPPGGVIHPPDGTSIYSRLPSAHVPGLLRVPTPSRAS
jgi:AraC-like DNA-binding protein